MIIDVNANLTQLYIDVMHKNIAFYEIRKKIKETTTLFLHEWLYWFCEHAFLFLQQCCLYNSRYKFSRQQIINMPFSYALFHT